MSDLATFSESGPATIGPVLIVAPDDDLHALEVGRHLDAAAVPWALLDLAAYPSRLALAMRYRDGEALTLRAANGCEIAAERVRALWWRRPRHPVIGPEVADPTHRQFAFQEARSALSGFWACVEARWINPIAADLAAGYKPYQLKVARECGLSVPDTLITNEPDAAAAFIDRYDGKVVYKALLGLPDAWRETRMLRPDERRLLALVQHAPVIFQEPVPGNDLRVTMIGARCFAAEMDSARSRYPYDIRMDMTVPIEPVSLDPETLAAIRRLMRCLGLEYGAIDLKRRADGGLSFLEINPSGQFLFIEELAGLPIAEAMAQHLAFGLYSEPTSPATLTQAGE